VGFQCANHKKKQLKRNSIPNPARRSAPQSFGCCS